MAKLKGHLWAGKLGRHGPKARLQLGTGASHCKKVMLMMSMQTPCRTPSGGRTLPNALFAHYRVLIHRCSHQSFQHLNFAVLFGLLCTLFMAAFLVAPTWLV